MTLIYFGLAALGIALLVLQPHNRQDDHQETMIVGIIYAILGAVLFMAFAVALFLPPKPYNWVVGIVMMAIGMTSCCFIPFLIPLLIYWVKPETKAFFGRN